MADLEDCLKRIQTHKGVIGIIILNNEGIAIRTTLDNSATINYVAQYHKLIQAAKGSVRDIDPQNELTFLRVRTKKHEVMLAPCPDYIMMVVQAPHE